MPNGASAEAVHLGKASYTWTGVALDSSKAYYFHEIKETGAVNMTATDGYDKWGWSVR